MEEGNCGDSFMELCFYLSNHGIFNRVLSEETKEVKEQDKSGGISMIEIQNEIKQGNCK